MTVSLASLRLNLDAVENGGWVGDIPEMGDLVLHVRGLDCKAARNLLDRKGRSRASRLPASVLESAARVNRDNDLSDVLESIVLIDWRNLADEGAPVPYSLSMARRLIREPEYRPFRLAVIWAADRVGRPA